MIISLYLFIKRLDGVKPIKIANWLKKYGKWTFFIMLEQCKMKLYYFFRFFLGLDDVTGFSLLIFKIRDFVVFLELCSYKVVSHEEGPPGSERF